MTISNDTIQQIGVIVGLISATGIFVGFGNKLKKWLSLRGGLVYWLISLLTVIIYLVEGIISGNVKVDWLAGNVALIQPVYLVLKGCLSILAKIRVGGAISTVQQTVATLPAGTVITTSGTLNGVDQLPVTSDSVTPVTPADFQ